MTTIYSDTGFQMKLARIAKKIDDQINDEDVIRHVWGDDNYDAEFDQILDDIRIAIMNQNE